MKMTGFEKWFINRSRHAERVTERAEELLRSVNMQGKQNFLEVGCGNGAVCKYVAEKYRLNVTGIDVDPEQIHLAQENISDIPDISFQVVDGTKLPFPDNDFDIVLSFGVMHHISNWQDALKEIKRVLKPEGHFIYRDLVYPELIAKFGRSFKHSYGIITNNDLDAVIYKSGFSTIHTSRKNSLIWYELEAVYQSD